MITFVIMRVLHADIQAMSLCLYINSAEVDFGAILGGSVGAVAFTLIIAIIVVIVLLIAWKTRRDKSARDDM